MGHLTASEVHFARRPCVAGFVASRVQVAEEPICAYSQRELNALDTRGAGGPVVYDDEGRSRFRSESPLPPPDPRYRT